MKKNFCETDDDFATLMATKTPNVRMEDDDSSVFMLRYYEFSLQLQLHKGSFDLIRSTAASYGGPKSSTKMKMRLFAEKKRKKSIVHSEGDASSGDNREHLDENAQFKNIMLSLDNNYCAPTEQILNASKYPPSHRSTTVNDKIAKAKLAGKLTKLKWMIRNNKSVGGVSALNQELRKDYKHNVYSDD